VTQYLNFLTILKVGYDKGGLPVGIQFIGRPWSEATLLHLAYAMQVSTAKWLRSWSAGQEYIFF
jgi:Asp-tRNA(Asn)/Glu-tRNA(Gln) amidotransferase A subunit family amidase